MEDNNETEQKSRDIANLRIAMMVKDYKKVRRLCSEVPEGPLERISIYDDTVLHMAAHSKQNDLLLDLLKMIPEDRNDTLSIIKNTDGNTILHEVATSDVMTDVARELLRIDTYKLLLTATNDLGEKPIFCAARYGSIQMYQILADQMDLKKLSPEERKSYFQRNDGTTILHISIAAESFGLALSIADSYPYLIEQRDQFWMTALQYLACNPTAFKRWQIQKRRGFIELLSNSKFKKKPGVKEFFVALYDLSFGDKKSMERYNLQELVELLVKKDTSWNRSIASQAMSPCENKKEPKVEKCSCGLSQKKKGQNSQESSTNKDKKCNESPLFLATISNIEEIVEGVLNYKPEALKYTNKEGMNILHVAILYRHIDIFDMVVRHEVFAKRLLSATDNEKNSVLHMVSQKRKSQASEKMQSPALQLRNELLLFEKVKSACENLVPNPLNNDNKTAEELFAATNEQLHQEAKEWLVRTAENCIILSVFIATVAFAAVYTVPGGPNQNTGIPILQSKPFFLVFVLSDVISLTLALTSVGIFLSILTSSFPLEDFKIYLFKKLTLGIICLVLSVSMMAVAFGATIVLIMIESPENENVVWSVVAFLPVPIFFLSYSPLRSAVLGPCREWFELPVLYLILVVVLGAILPPYLLLVVIYLVFRGFVFIIRKSTLWFWRINDLSTSNTESSHPTAALISGTSSV